MPPLFITAAIIQAILFQVYYLVTKSLQEKGLSIWDIFRYQSLAVIPGGILLVIFFKWEYFTFLRTHPLALTAVLFCSGVWIVHTFFRLSVIEATNSLSYFNAFSAVISLPLLLMAGIVMNRDYPNSLMIVGLILLGIGLALQPTIHEKNIQKQTLAMGISLAVILLTFGQTIDAINSAAFRYFLQNFKVVMFANCLFIFLSTLVIAIVILVRNLLNKGPKKGRANRRGYILPIIFVIATLFEGYSLSGISVYALVAAGSITFLVSAVGDLHSKRIKFNLRTLIFFILVTAGTILAAMSVG